MTESAGCRTSSSWTKVWIPPGRGGKSLVTTRVRATTATLGRGCGEPDELRAPGRHENVQPGPGDAQEGGVERLVGGHGTGRGGGGEACLGVAIDVHEGLLAVRHREEPRSDVGLAVGSGSTGGRQVEVGVARQGRGW